MKNKLQIFIVKGDITTAEVDAITNAANNHLWMGSGVAGAIKKIGGKIIEDEAIKKGPIQIGSAIETSAGNLNAKYVIHAAVMGQDLITNSQYIKSATQSTLELCEKLKLKSVALPAFGTGVGGFSKKECAEIMLEVVLNYNPVHLKQVYFYLFDEETKNIFEKTLKEKLKN